MQSPTVSTLMCSERILTSCTKKDDAERLIQCLTQALIVDMPWLADDAKRPNDLCVLISLRPDQRLTFCSVFLALKRIVKTNSAKLLVSLVEHSHDVVFLSIAGFDYAPSVKTAFYAARLPWRKIDIPCELCALHSVRSSLGDARFITTFARRVVPTNSLLRVEWEPGSTLVTQTNGSVKEYEEGFGVRALHNISRKSHVVDITCFVRPFKSLEDDRTFVRRIQREILHIHSSQCDWYKWRFANYDAFQCTVNCIGAHQ